MKQLFALVLFSFIINTIFSQSHKQYFPPEQLTTVGAYYYPEHWDESQWERDIKKMAEMGFELSLIHI